MHVAEATPPRGRISHYLVPAALALLVGVLVLVVVTSMGGSSRRSSSASALDAKLRHLPQYWTVRPGDSFALIGQKTGLKISQLEAFNPSVDPRGLAAGTRLNLHPPGPKAAPHPPWPKPHWWTVKSGESFGSIAAKTGISITTIEQLNPDLKPDKLQPGDRVRLREGEDVRVDPSWTRLWG